MSKKAVFFGLVVIGAGVVGGLVYQKKNSGPEAVEVQTSAVERREIVQTVSATGRIQPKTQVKISADVSAKITKLGVKEGDWVEKGDFLLELDRESYVATVEREEANLRSSQSGVTLADENVTKTEKDYKRTRELFERGLESQSVLDAAYAAYEVEKARRQSARDQVEQVRAALKQTQDNLSKTTIYAPISGTVSRLDKEQGEIALGSQFQEDVIMIISNLSGMEALVDVDENDIVLVAIGDEATIEVDALTNQTFKGIVTEIANSAKISADGTANQKTEFEVKIAITDVNEALRPGMTAGGDIVTDVRPDVTAIPIQSVTLRTPEQLQEEVENGSPSNAMASDEPNPNYTADKDGFVQVVFVVKDGKSRAVQVTTGIQSDTDIEILAGLDVQDEVVIGSYRAISKDLGNGTQVSTDGEGEATEKDKDKA